MGEDDSVDTNPLTDSQLPPLDGNDYPVINQVAVALLISIFVLPIMGAVFEKMTQLTSCKKYRERGHPGTWVVVLLVASYALLVPGLVGDLFSFNIEANLIVMPPMGLGPRGHGCAVGARSLLRSSAAAMSSAEAKFNTDGNGHRTALHDHLTRAKTEYGGHTNFSAYRQGRDPQFLGVNGKNYYAKPWGNDSSNIQAVLNGPAYWKRIYYRENIAARFQREDEQAAAAAEAAEAAMAGTGAKKAMRKSQSDSAMGRLPSEPVDGYAQIKETMRPFVEQQGKPRIRKMETGERLNFFNTLGNKYHMKAGGKNLSWDVSKQTHRSSKTEMNWIVSNYFRTDTPAVLAGCGTGGSLPDAAQTQ